MFKNYTMMNLRLFIVFLFFLSFSYSQEIRINEVSSSNTLFLDEDGDSPDWIELHNYGSSEISLNQWTLTDIEDDNNPWTFPNISIEPNDFLLVWASDKDRSDIFYVRTLINQGELFRYEIANENIEDDWISNSFDDDEWGIGNTGFGFSDNASTLTLSFFSASTMKPSITSRPLCATPAAPSSLSKAASRSVSLNRFTAVGRDVRR